MRRVAIVGFAPSWRDVPWQDSTLEVWGMNYHFKDLPRYDRIFETHEWKILQQEGNIEAMSQLTVPIYMQQVRPEIPTSVAYPLAQIRERYTVPESDNPYLTNTASFMIALAIEEGVDEIRIYGIDMAHNTEYGRQRPSCEFFLGVAFGRGIKVWVHPDSDLLKSAFIYGYDDVKKVHFLEKLKNRKKFLQDQLDIHENQIRLHQQAVHEFLGARNDCDHIIENWVSD